MELEGRRVVVGCLLVGPVAAAGSLYYSLGLGLYPCELRWYHRILMYPLVVVFGYGTLVGWPDVHRVVLPLAVPGLAVALYHPLQRSPSSTCAVGGCGGVQLRVLGRSIPNQSALAFALVTAGMLFVWRAYRRDATVTWRRVAARGGLRSRQSPSAVSRVPRGPPRGPPGPGRWS